MIDFCKKTKVTETNCYIFLGKCKNGKCQPFCITKGFRPCFCTKTELQCDRCCADANRTAEGRLVNCRPYRDANGEGGHKLPENATCAFGNCNKKVRRFCIASIVAGDSHCIKITAKRTIEES